MMCHIGAISTLFVDITQIGFTMPCHMEWLNRVCVGNQDDKLDLFVLDYVFFIVAVAAAVILTCTTPTLCMCVHVKRKSRKNLLKLVHRLDIVLCNKIIYFPT